MKKRKPFARKRFGQHFLSDPSVVDRIVAAADVSDDEHVFEIGPGRGALTESLLSTGAEVTVIEVDRDLSDVLRVQFKLEKRFNLITADVLSLDWSEHVYSDRNNKIIANLPYNISTPLLFKIVKHRTLFHSVTVMVQKELAERICHTGEGGKLKTYGGLSVIMNTVFKPTLLFTVPPECFVPQPKVDSAVLTLEPKREKLQDENAFFNFVRSAFNFRRKLLINQLKKNEPELVSGLSSTDLEFLSGARPENLLPQHYVRLFYQGRICGD